MKLHQALIVAALSLSVFIGNASAQDSEGPAFGKGRLLKKMRDDIFKLKPKFKLPSFKKPSVTSAKPKLKFPPPASPKVPTPALSSNSNVPANTLSTNSKAPTPALPSAGSRPAPTSSAAYRHPIQPISPDEKSLASGSGSTQFKTSDSSAGLTKSSLTPQAIQNVTRSAKKQSQAFGMLLETKGEKLVVTQINPAGNASKAGIRKGDSIMELGGLDLSSMLAFNEITDVLKDGDQIELLVDRAGKESQKLVMFGRAPAVTTGGPAQPSNFGGPVNRTARNVTSRNTSNLSQYELVPSNSTMHSVIESAESQPTAGAVMPKAAPQTWKYNSGRRNAEQNQAVRSAAVRGETILNVTK